MEWPAIIIVGSGYIYVTYSNTFYASFIKVSTDKSSKSPTNLESPWPLKSKLTKLANYFTSLAKQAKLYAESPAPCKQKNIGPLPSPATYIEVPSSIYIYLS